MLNLYRRALQLRAQLLTPTGDTTVQALTQEAGILSYRRAATMNGAAGELVCLTNFSEEPVDLPEGEPVLTSGPLENGRLPQDTTAWVLRPAGENR